MRILVLVGSEKRCDNTEKIVDSFYSGIDRTKHEVQILNVSTMKINPCRDCNQCKHLKEKSYIQKDDMNVIYDAVMQSKCVVLAYPVYFSFMPGKLKMVLDRFRAFGKRFNYEYPQKKLIILMSSSDDIEEILKINKGRWEIEESFRIMKTNMKSRPVFLQKDNRIEAHFLTCFLGLFFYRVLEKKCDSKYTVNEIIETLKEMNYFKLDEGYVPTYKRTELTDKLQSMFQILEDSEIIPNAKMKKMINSSKKQTYYAIYTQK